MNAINNIKIIRDFPACESVKQENYNDQFKDYNVIINAKSSNISYPKHWGGLSIKFAFGGNEYYESDNCLYTVNQNNYLIFNRDKSYSSYIFSKTKVNSFTINFSSFFEQKMYAGLFSSLDVLLNNTNHNKVTRIDFIEKLYQHDNIISPVLSDMYKLTSAATVNYWLLEEKYYELLEKLLLLQNQTYKEIQKVKANKFSTRLELYKRLHQARDYIESCYTTEITLDKLALITCLNSAYFLRQFKQYFRLTPYQYLINKRMSEAKKLLKNSNESVTEVCFAVGYQDPASFIKLFKRYYHFAPHYYRQKLLC